MAVNNASTYDLNTLLYATAGACSASSGHMRGISIDTRTLQSGNAYLAIRGEQLDGHRFAKQAIERGASFVIVDHLCKDIDPNQQIIVPHTLKALQDIARYRRLNWQRLYGQPVNVIAITGSVGKTSTKDMLAHMLLKQCNVYATKGNYNNHIGMPLTLLNAPDDTDYLVLEMGMNHGGEIALLSDIARPNVAIITAIEAVHSEFFRDIAAIADAKAEIMQGMAPSSPVILPQDSPYIEQLQQHAKANSLQPVFFGTDTNAHHQAHGIHVDSTGTYYRYHQNNTDTHIHIAAKGQHYALNATAALAACKAYATINIDHATAQLREFQEPVGRGNSHVAPWKDGVITLIDETYNASPASMKAAIARLGAIAHQGQRMILALGDMRELGENTDAHHADLASIILQHPVACTYTTGSHMRHLHDALPKSNRHHSNNTDELTQALCRDLQAGDIVLLKASHGVHLENVITTLEALHSNNHDKYVVPERRLELPLPEGN